MRKPKRSEVIVVGGGLAGLSAAIYLGRAKRRAMVVDTGKSMARWEPDVQNYLGFPNGIGGRELIQRARQQARRYGARFVRDSVVGARFTNGCFILRGEKSFYTCERLLLATGIFHVPPDLPHVEPCLGHSMFFCRDCDGYRVQGKSIAIYGWTNEAVDYALGMLLFSPRVILVTAGHPIRWDEQHATWVEEYKMPVFQQPVRDVHRRGNQIESLEFADGLKAKTQALFTTRGDIYYNQLAKDLGAGVDASGEILVDGDMRTSVKGLYAAGCVTPANCQMIIAAGQGATAAQAINRDLFEESLANHALRRFRKRQLRHRATRPAIEAVVEVTSKERGGRERRRVAENSRSPRNLKSGIRP